MKYQIQITIFVLLFTSICTGQTMENLIFYGTCLNENAGKMELVSSGEEEPAVPVLVLDTESLVLIQGTTLPTYFQLPDGCLDYLPHLDIPMFDFVEGRRYLVVFGKKNEWWEVEGRHYLVALEKETREVGYCWQFMDYEVHIHDLDETVEERNYRKVIESSVQKHVGISSLKKIQKKVTTWQTAIKERSVPLNEFLSDLGKPIHVNFDNKEGTVTLTFDYYSDIENPEELVSQNPDFYPYPNILHPQIVAREQDGIIIEIKYSPWTSMQIPSDDCDEYFE